jgi:hypothetical protein
MLGGRWLGCSVRFLDHTPQHPANLNWDTAVWCVFAHERSGSYIGAAKENQRPLEAGS